VRRIAADAGYTETSFDAVERALAVGRKGGPPRAELGGGLTVTRSSHDLIFAWPALETTDVEGCADCG
jgi:hypothetical protein